MSNNQSAPLPNFRLLFVFFSPSCGGAQAKGPPERRKPIPDPPLWGLPFGDRRLVFNANNPTEVF